MNKNIRVTAFCLVAAVSGASLQTQANVVISGTRLIYMSDASDISVRLTSDNAKPVLVQAWTDEGDMNAAPKDIRTPFTIPTPVFRMEPQKSQMLRLIFSGDASALPADRESLFWFNTLEIPSLTAAEKDKNILQMAFRNRIKIFYRPVGLKDDVFSAPESLTFSVSGNRLKVVNPTPFHVSFSAIKFSMAGKELNYEGGGMVTPKNSAEFVFKSELSSSGKVVADILNDYGAINRYTAEVGKSLVLVKSKDR